MAKRRYRRKASSRNGNNRPLVAEDEITGDWLVVLPYGVPGFVYIKDELKRIIPPADRKWVGGAQHWVVARKHYPKLQKWARQHFNKELPDVAMIKREQKPHTLTFTLEYVGAVRLRDDGTRTASGWIGGNWNMIFPEDVIKSYWLPGYVGRGKKGPVVLTHFDVLGIKRTADDTDIKKAYRRLARLTHPDVSSEPDAKERFMEINVAFEALKTPQLRKRYLFSLKAGKKATKAISEPPKKNPYSNLEYDWSPPVKCGIITVDVTPSVNGMLCHAISNWEDITDSNGRTMVASWDNANKRPVISWA